MEADATEAGCAHLLSISSLPRPRLVRMLTPFGPVKLLDAGPGLAATFPKMKLSLVFLVVFSTVCFAAPMISTPNKVAVHFYMESL
jgi:hypothetical protein